MCVFHFRCICFNLERLPNVSITTFVAPRTILKYLYIYNSDLLLIGEKNHG